MDIKKKGYFAAIPTESVLLNFTTHRLVGLFVQADYTTFPKFRIIYLGFIAKGSYS